MSINTLKIEKLVFGGYGLARDGDGVILIPDVVAGDVVEVEEDGAKGGARIGRVVKIVDPSPYRRETPCPYFGECGGCDWLHIYYDEQVRCKKEILIDCAARIGKFKPPVDVEVFTAGEFGYRIRAQIKVDHENRCAGFFRKKTNDVVRIDRCLLLDERLNGVLAGLNGGMIAGIINPAPAGLPYGEINKSHRRDDRHCERSEAILNTDHGTNNSAAIRDVRHCERSEAIWNTDHGINNSAAIRDVRHCERSEAIWNTDHSINNSVDNNGIDAIGSINPRKYIDGVSDIKVLIGDRPAGDPVIDGLTGATTEINVSGVKFLADGGCFFQSNGFLLEALGRWAKGFLGGGFCLDLYGGIGFFSLMLADDFDEIALVENVAGQVRAAERNFAANRKDHIRAVLADVERGAGLRAAAGGRRPDCVVVDPPRPGLVKSVRKWLADASPRRVLYVSCNPSTFARDAGALLGGGYKLTKLALFDLYPNTHHIETAGIFVK